jgi:hypothetical protein
VILALALRPEAHASPPPETPEPAPPPSSEPAPSPAPLAIAVGIGAVGDARSLPSPSAGPSVWVSALAGRARAQAFAQYLFARSTSEQAGTHTAIDLLSGGARGCLAPTVDPLRFELCAGAEAGSLRGRGVGFLHDRTMRGLWVSLLTGPFVGYDLTRSTELWAGAEAGLPLRAPAFSANSLGEVRGRPDWVARITVGAQVRFR